MKRPISIRMMATPAVLRAIVALGTFVFVAWIFIGTFSDFDFGSIDTFPLALSAVLYAASVATLPFFWVIMLNIYAPQWRANSRGGNLQLVLAYSRSWIARYVPGRIWMFGGRVLYGSAMGIPKWTVLKSAVVEGLMLQAITLWLAGMTVLIFFDLWIPAIGLAILVPLLYGVYLKKSDRVISVIPVQRLRDFMTLPANRSAVVAFVFGVAINVTLLASATLLATAVLDVDTRTAWMISGFWGISVVAGYVTTVTPAGLGVREAVGILLLGTVIDSADAALFMGAARSLGLALDFGLAVSVEIYAHFINGRFSPRPQRHDESTTLVGSTSE